MAGDIVIERLSLDGVLRGMNPDLQQGIIGIFFIFISLIIPKEFWLLGIFSFCFGGFLVLDIIVSKTIGWDSLLER